MAKHGKAFTDDLGGLFEHYIGRQLRLIEDAEVKTPRLSSARVAVTRALTGL